MAYRTFAEPFVLQAKADTYFLSGQVRPVSVVWHYFAILRRIRNFEDFDEEAKSGVQPPDLSSRIGEEPVIDKCRDISGCKTPFPFSGKESVEVLW